MWVTFYILVLHNNLKKLEVLYVVTSLLVPALIAIVRLVTRAYGLNSDGNICNIYANTSVAFIKRLALWDGPGMLMLIAASTATFHGEKFQMLISNSGSLLQTCFFR